MPLGTSRYDEAQLQRRLWTPAALAGSLAFWFDAMDASTLTIGSGGGVSQWNDKSGNGRNATQATGANQPIFTPNANNGTRPALVFTRATPMWLDTAAFTNPATFQYAGIAYSVDVTLGQIIVNQNTGSNRSPQYHEMTENATTGAFDAYTFSSTGVVETPQAAAGSAINNRLQISCLDASSTLSAGYTDGAAWTLATGTRTGTNGTQSSALNIGAFSNHANTDALGGGICEFLCTTSYVGDRIRVLLEGYLAWKWGTQLNLNAAHPFKNSPPLIGF